MLKIIRIVLYGLAILTGMAGLLDGGTPLVKYILEQWRDHEYRGYYDTNYLNAPKIIFLLSLILLVGVRIGLALDRGIRPANPPHPASPGNSPAAASETSQPSGTVGTTAQTGQETADEKLARLLNQKKD